MTATITRTVPSARPVQSSPTSLRPAGARSGMIAAAQAAGVSSETARASGSRCTPSPSSPCSARSPACSWPAASAAALTSPGPR